MTGVTGADFRGLRLEFFFSLLFCVAFLVGPPRGGPLLVSVFSVAKNLAREAAVGRRGGVVPVDPVCPVWVDAAGSDPAAGAELLSAVVGGFGSEAGGDESAPCPALGRGAGSSSGMLGADCASCSSRICASPVAKVAVGDSAEGAGGSLDQAEAVAGPSPFVEGPDSVILSWRAASRVSIASSSLSDAFSSARREKELWEEAGGTVRRIEASV